MCSSPGTHQNCRQKAVRAAALVCLSIRDPDRTNGFLSTPEKVTPGVEESREPLPLPAGPLGVTVRNLKEMDLVWESVHMEQEAVGRKNRFLYAGSRSKMH